MHGVSYERMEQQWSWPAEGALGLQDVEMSSYAWGNLESIS